MRRDRVCNFNFMSHPSCITILLIDDYAEARLELCHFLQQDSLYTYRILEFEKTTQALEWCQQEIPDIILLGFMLPDEDRLKFIQQFRECHSNTQTAVIMLTGQGDEIIAVRAMKIAIAIQQASAYEQAQAELAKRQKTEAALKASEEKLKLTLNFADIGYWEWNPITNQIFAENASHWIFSEPSGANLTYEQWLNQIHPDDREWVEQEFRQAIATQTDYVVEYRVACQDGSIRWVSIKGRGLYDESGQLLRMLGVLIDITERKLLEEERRHAEIPRIELHLLEQILEVVLAGYWHWDIPGNQQYLSLTFKQMFGYEDHELPNTPESWQRLIFPEDLPGVLEIFEQHVQSRGKIPYYNEVRYRHKDGSTVWVICSGRVISWDQDGNPLRMIGCHIDITQRKQVEAQLRQTNEQLAKANVELARATRLKDEFLANMSHELRTPLNAILGMSEGLQESVFGSINERQAKAIATIERSGRHLLELINDILDLSKIESGKLELQLSDVSVRSLCDASLAFVKQMALKKNIRLSIHVSENIDSIQVDDRRLRQVLINLLSNAVKFTPEGGSVTLEVRLEGAGEAGGVNFALAPLSTSCFPKLCFHVTDTGIGIAAEEIGKLFQPFIQLDSSLNRQYSGTGLGLALVKQIVTLHGGTASVSSEVGRGSCFTVRIPHHKSDYLSIKQVTTSLPSYCLNAENAQVLIVEDSIAAADQITRYLSEMGMQAIIYPKGEGAVEEVLRVQPALVILDLQLPNLSGWDVLNQLKSNPKTKDIPAIIISVVDERSKGLAQGAFEYLVKPITRAQLQAAINKLQPSARSKSLNLVLPKAPLKPPLILLAEDNQANIDTMSGYLEARGYHLILANNGQQAINLVRVQRPDLIVMDIQMPRMDGLEAIRLIRDDRKFVDIPIIALTALAMPGDRETCLAAGANQYLTKPIKLKQLVVTIQQLLKR